MLDQACEKVHHWLHQGDAAFAPMPSPELVAHVVGCARCRGLLALYAAALLPVAGPSSDLPCVACQEMIDPYIDCEQRHSSAAAAQRYPQVWWHLWVCADCAEVYQLTVALLDAQRLGVLAPMPLLTLPSLKPPPQLPLVRLARAFLHTVFGQQMALGAAWGSADDEALLAEERHAEYHIEILARQTGASHWDLIVAVLPALGGWATVSCAELHYTARFDPAGRAVFATIPITLLAAASGADMLISIEHEQQSS